MKAESDEAAEDAGEEAASPEAETAGEEAEAEPDDAKGTSEEAEESAASEAAEDAGEEAGESEEEAPEEADDGWLPVLTAAETNQKRVAILVEGCASIDNTQTIVRTAFKYEGRVTLCPTGNMVEKKAMKDTLRLAVDELGDEVEATAWSGKEALYAMPDEDMAKAVWRYGQAVGKALGIRWQPHFYRMPEGKGEQDQRTHSYLKQLGYRAVIAGSIDGVAASAEEIKEQVKPGAVLVFDSGKASMAKARELIPWLSGEGYAMVTLDELFGFEAEEAAPFEEGEEMPLPRAFERDYPTYKQGDYAWAIHEMQEQLQALGHLKLKKNATGFFGEMTVEAVRAFQTAEKLPVTGEADETTQRRLEAAAGAGEAEETAPEAEAEEAAKPEPSDAEPKDDAEEAESDAGDSAEEAKSDAEDGEEKAESDAEDGAEEEPEGAPEEEPEEAPGAEASEAAAKGDAEEA